MVRVVIRILAGMAAFAPPALWAEKTPPPPEPKPAVRIEVAPLGYYPPGAFYLTYQLSSAALGFFDNQHLLFTFRVGGLLRRIPGDPSTDDDQQIRAVVLDLASGKVTQQTEWRMHDRLQYLWPLTQARFLVRRRNTLFLTGPSLELEPWMTFDAAIQHIQISPDRRLLIVETEEAEPAAAPEAQRLGAGRPVAVTILDIADRMPIASLKGQAPSLLPITGDGLLDVLEGKAPGYWAMRDIPFHGAPKIVGQIKSGCQPWVRPLSATAVFVEGCYLDGEDHAISVLAMDGRELWHDRWENRYVWGWFDTAENGSRFAYESVEVGRPISSFDALYPEDVQGQMVGVYDTESGRMVLVRDASPVLTAGQNVALSPDGTRFAVLRNGAIEVYDLPPLTAPQPAGGEVAAKKKK